MARTKHIYDLIVIGAGSAGISALKEAKKYSDNVVLISEDDSGNTCARTGCMPSKALIYAANLYDSHKKMPHAGIAGSDQLYPNIPEIMKKVREKRDHFLSHLQSDMKQFEPHIIKGTARYESPTSMRVGNRLLHCKASIIATGSSPIVPKAYEKIKEHIITTDTLFERKDLPKRMAVVGLGAIGLEVAQALARLGIDITAISKSDDIGVVHDPEIKQVIQEALAEDMKIWLDAEPQVRLGSKGIVLQTQTQEANVDAIFVAAGRGPNTSRLGLKRLGIDFNGAGVPRFERYTMKVFNHPIYLAGDVTDERAILHESSDEGRRAAYHAINGEKKISPRYPNMQIIFTKPEIAVVGETKYALRHDDIIVGEASFEDQGRAKIEDKNQGKLHLFADEQGYFRGGEIMAPAGEHLAHFLSLALSQRLTVKQMLETPFYHPTLEEGLKTALTSLSKQLSS